MKNVFGYLFLIAVFTSQVISGTVYYVDATNGKDDYNGLSVSSAWQTISKVNEHYFLPGDSILFKRGEEWREQLIVPSSGSINNPITFGAYGTGNLPIINGSNQVSGWTKNAIYENIWQATLTNEREQVFFDGTRGTNAGSMVAINAANEWYWDSNVLNVHSSSDPDTAFSSLGIEAYQRDYGITATSKNYITVDGLDIRNAKLIGIDVTTSDNWIIQNCNVQDYGDGDANAAGISFHGATGYADNCDSILIDSNTIGKAHCSNDGSVERAGIRLHGIDNSTICNNVIITGQTTTGAQGILIYLSHAGTLSTDNIIEYNEVTGCEIAGIQTRDSDGTIIRYNKVHNHKGCGIGCSYNSTGTKCYYNLIYDSQSASTQGNHFNGIDINNSSVNGFYYNNVIYDVDNFCLTVETNAEGNTIKNNIFDSSNNSDSQPHPVYVDSTIDSVTIGNNDYYDSGDSTVGCWKGFAAGNHKTLAEWIALTSETGSLNSDPLMTDPSNDDFNIQVGSPCINAGTDVGLIQDYAGITVPYGWGVDIGAYEYVGDSPLNVDISASPTLGWIPLTVDFTSSVSGGTEPYSYEWDFGDDKSSSEQHPSHTYSKAGDYTVTLTVTDSHKNQDADSLIIRASEKADPLEASISASPFSGEAPLNVNFTGSATGGIPSYSYSWNFGDGASSSIQNPSHTYSAAGNYIVILTVTDFNSSQVSDSLTINVYVNPTYQLAISAATGSPVPGAGGTTDPSPGNHSYSVGNSVQVEALPNENYRFSKWTGDVSDSETYNKEVSITMDKDKSISAFFCAKCGDVTGDLSITPADSQAAFEIFLGIISNPTDSEKENADVNCSGTKTEPSITPGDAQAIFEKFLGINELPSDCSGSSRSGSVLALKRFIPMRQASDVNLIINDVRVDQGGEVVVPIIVDNPFNIKAFGFDLIFPSEILEFVGVERSGLLEDFYQVDANMIAEGVVRAGGYGSEAIKSHNPRVLITLVFKVIGEVEGGGISSFSIVNTVDDIKNASFKNERVIERVREPRHIRRNKERIK